MADSTVHALSDGTTPAGTDEFLVARSPFGAGDDRKLTWTELLAAMPGGEIGYDEVTSSVVVSSATEASGTTVITCAAHTFDGAPVMATFFCPRASPAVSDQILLSLFEGATQIGRIALITGVGNIAFAAQLRFTPSAAAHTYKVTASRASTNGNLICGSGGTGTEVPMFIRFTKV